MSFPRYPSYRSSGVEWLGDVPSHWGMYPLKRELRYITSGSRGWAENYSDSGSLFIRIANLTRNRIELDLADVQRVAVPEGSEGVRTRVRAGDILFSITAYLGSIAVVPDGIDEAYVSQHVALARLRSPSSLPRWIGYVALSDVGRTWFDMQSYGGTKVQLSLDDVRELPVPAPPVSEQAAIVTFLDRETAKIDALVAEQERLIGLLQEKRQAVISHAVTKGLNPDGPMKPSGIEWVGDVPSHWACVRNKVVFEEIDERSVTEDGELLTVSHITGVTPRSEKTVNMTMAETLEGYKRCRTGDLVINTMWAWMGALGCSPCDGLVSPSYNVYRARNAKALLPAYYDYLARVPSHRIAIKARSSGVWESRLRLYPDAFLSMSLPVPPPAEQHQIVAYLDANTRRWDALTAQAEATVDLLQERRSALVSSAVNGQIDVRGEVS